MQRKYIYMPVYNRPVKVFLLGGKFHPLGGDASTLLRALEKSSVGNDTILRMMQPFMQLPTAVIPLVVGQQDSIEMTVRVPRYYGSVGELHVCSAGMQCARAALRNVVSLTGETRILMTQNHEYSMALVLSDRARAFQLHLHRIEDIFSDTTHWSTPLSLGTLSHNFHPMDGVVEEVHHALVPRRCGRGSGVMGMLAVTKELLRRNVVAATVRSMGTNVGATVYMGMLHREVIEIVCAMSFVTDEKSVADALNLKHHRGKVVTQVENVGLMCAGDFDDASADVDCWMHHSNAPRYAIAFQNPSILGLARSLHGLNVQAVCTALYSGIAFCHACAYEMEAVEVSHGVRVHIINGTDFREDCIVEVNKMVKSTAIALSRTQQTWSDVRHNFRVKDDAGADTRVVSIQCHAAESGLIFFRCTDASHLSQTRDGFIGAVYIPPCIVKRPLSASASTWPTLEHPEDLEHQEKDGVHGDTVNDASRG